ncbi:hypothetical protein CUZ56_03041 [Saezia sanguinis]|uniref:Uncharacterized protein n=1 Tax=Saezia sanguinis TaxID=1965230 RepID=A0A433S9G3_9BURK|nr:hypothetical protein CUZ56_03041 [Saezia sanguinis]
MHVVLQLKGGPCRYDGTVTVHFHTPDVVAVPAYEVEVAVCGVAAKVVLPPGVSIQVDFVVDGQLPSHAYRAAQPVVFAAAAVQDAAASAFCEPIGLQVLVRQARIRGNARTVAEFKGVAAFGKDLDHAAVVARLVFAAQPVYPDVAFGVDVQPAVANAAFEVYGPNGGAAVADDVERVYFGV